MSQCTKCGCQFVTLPEHPTSDHLCRFCEIAELKHRAERAEAACAEMRACIDDNLFADNSGQEYIPRCFACGIATGDHEENCQAIHALSTSFGQGWASPETVAKWEKEREHCRQQAENWEARADKLQAENQLMREALEKIASSMGNYCDCNQPIELCCCAERIAKETLAKLNP